MRYYALYESGNLIAIGIGRAGQEITEAEYNALYSEITEKATLSDKLYAGEITIDDVPEEWREEIQKDVDERIAADKEAEERSIPAEEALAIILGGEI